MFAKLFFLVITKNLLLFGKPGLLGEALRFILIPNIAGFFLRGGGGTGRFEELIQY